MKKKIPVLVLGLAILGCTLFSISTITAYLADGDSARNPIVVGGNHISIEEDFQPEAIKPVGKITKKVRIKNEGPNRCFIRARVVFSDSQIGQYANIDWNLKDWFYDSTDEYYYYTSALDREDVTSWLMTAIQFNENMPAEDIEEVDVIVYAESYQSFGFLDYKEAWADYQSYLK